MSVPASPETSRIVNFVAIGVGFIFIFLAQFMAVTIVEDTGDSIKDSADNLDTFGGNEVIRDTNRALTQTVPTIMGFGLVLLGFVREYRRSRVGAARTRRRGGGGFP